MANKEWSPAELKFKAEAYCAAAERCEADVRTKLKQWNCTAATADEIVDFLYSANFLSDERYCAAFVHDKLIFQGWGRVKMEYMLRAKHLPAAAIRVAIDSIDEIEYFRVLSHLLETKRKTLIGNPVDNTDSIFRFLLQRGFTSNEIARVLNKN